jgi:hypothetical protein
MNNKPRINHFVPQFWIKKFAASDGTLWAYDHKTRQIRQRSSRQLMQIFNLYTVQPSCADDTTLEAIDLSKIDSRGSALFERVLRGDHSQATKDELASFFAVQILRDPDVVTSYNLHAQELCLSILEAFDAPDYFSFRQAWEAKYPGTSVTHEEYEHIRSLGLSGVENALDPIITALENSEGLPDLPFTDVVRSPDSRGIVRSRLLDFHWTLKTDIQGRFVLGDAAVIYQAGEMNSIKIPMCSDAALFLIASERPVNGISSIPADDYEIANLNLESASQSRRWLVGKPSELNNLQSQVGYRVLPK